jgi:periplasmic divalent cation tolerance protein
MTDKIIVLVTGGSVRECKKIARRLLEKRLIACANIVPLVRSLYRWQGKIADEKECLMILKSAREHFALLSVEVEKLHSYSVPEVIALPIIDGAPNYLSWIGESVGESPRGAD